MFTTRSRAGMSYYYRGSVLWRSSSCCRVNKRGSSSTTTATTPTAPHQQPQLPVDPTAPPMPAIAHPGRTTKIFVSNERSRAEIQRLVRRREMERNAWAVDGAVPAVRRRVRPSELWKFLSQTVPAMLSFRPPPPAVLDEHLPVVSMDWPALRLPPVPDQMQITWLSHSGLLLQMGGCHILTDPIFSERCSPSQYFGPQRYRPTPCTITELCATVPIDLVLISHNHYDHLDYNTVRAICELAPDAHFVVPLGLREWFRLNVSKTVAIYEQDWHESMEFVPTRRRRSVGDTTASESSVTAPPLTVTSLPMRHWSNRTGDRDQTLWCGFSVVSGTRKFLFAGDTAWFDGLHGLGRRYGPWDVAAIPIGAYEPRHFMKGNHINVAEAVRLKDAVRATAAVPIHWGTFPLTTEPVLEPRDQLAELMAGRRDSSTFVPWRIGETKQF